MPPSIIHPWNSPTAAGVSVPQHQDHEQPLHEWDFHLSTIVCPSVAAEAADAIGAIEFDHSEQLLATAGIARKIRIYAVQSLLSDDASCCSYYYMCTPAKLSSLRWRRDGPPAIGAGDYDGVVTEYDVERRVPVFERDEHGGRRVWSVDYSPWAPCVGASGSDDGTAQVWDSRCPAGSTAAVFRPSGTGSAPVCSAEFDQSADIRIGLGCADSNAYLYDLRMAIRPLSVLRGHSRTVTYVRFGRDRTILTASTDGSIKMWNRVESTELRTFKGHHNSRSFVGLSVWRTGGLVGCGSESNEIYLYDTRWSRPIWVRSFGGCDGEGDDGSRNSPGRQKDFVSAIAWRQSHGDAHECVAIAGGSNGKLQLCVGKKRKRTRRRRTRR